MTLAGPGQTRGVNLKNTPQTKPIDPAASADLPAPNFPRSPERWAHVRFSVVGALLSSPPESGQLHARLAALAAQLWRHPISGQWVRFGASTIERWYYLALRETQDPVGVLRRKIRSDQGKHPAVSAALAKALCEQYRTYPSWSYKLHIDNLAVLAKQRPELGRCPSYPCLVRYMKSQGLRRRERRGPRHSPGAQAAEARFEQREVRSYEVEYVHALWHLDFHHGRLRVLRPDGRWVYPLLLGIMDDRSRLCCHAQWYLAEGAEELCHGLSQALQKRALPRSLMSDNGSAMIAMETVQGLARLGIRHERTRPYSPQVNGKQENYWCLVEGRLLPMLEGVVDLSLAQLNDATQAWLEMEYNRRPHSELDQTPLAAYLSVKEVGRPCPSTAELALAFTAETSRKQRRSDGTFALDGVRFEVPAHYGHFERLSVRYASWNLRQVHLCDPQTGKILCPVYPLDKARNAAARRATRSAEPLAPLPEASGGPAPLLGQLIAQYAALGVPPAYLPKDEIATEVPHA